MLVLFYVEYVHAKSVGVSGGVGIKEGSALLQEVVDLAFLGSGTHGLASESSRRSSYSQDDLSGLIQRYFLSGT